MNLRFNLDEVQIQFSNRDGAFTTYTVGWVVGILECNAKLTSKLRRKLKLSLAKISWFRVVWWIF